MVALLGERLSTLAMAVFATVLAATVLIVKL
jgi:hypothetical protein